MAAAERIQALRGMRDVFSVDYARRRQIERALERHLRLHSYVPIELPILENTELYLRKSGEEISARLFEFSFRDRRIALRPELTASILRAYVERLQDEPLPLRVQYAGPVFRYEKPQQNRYRQFTLAGAELLGASGAQADAEVLHLACGGLERLGIRDYQLVIGHTAVLGGFLTKLGLRKQLHNHLLRNMENLRKRGRRHVIESLAAIFPEFEAGAARPMARDSASNQQLIKALREMTDEEARQAITDFLHSLNIRIDSNRAEGEIIDRLLRKIREDEQGPKLRVALEFMEELGKLIGPPAEVLPRARALARRYDLDDDAIAALEAALERLERRGALCGEIALDFGLNRGLNYYTGVIFEIHGKTPAGEALQLCGGGRYDNLVSILGGSEPTPAAGFAYGVERVASLLAPGAKESLNRPDVYLIPIHDDDMAAGMRVADELRARDFAVEVSIDGRSLRRSLKHADRKGAEIVIIIGESERKQRSVILRDMRGHSEWTVDIDELPKRIEELAKSDD